MARSVRPGSPPPPPPSPGPPRTPPGDGSATPGGWWKPVAWVLLLTLVVALLIWGPQSDEHDEHDERALTYTEFMAAVDDRRIATAAISPDGSVVGQRSDDTGYRSRVPVELAGERFLDRLDDAGVVVEAVDDDRSWLAAAVGSLLALAPLLLLLGFWMYLGRRARGAMGGALGMGRARRKVFDASRPTTTFDDVAGYEGVKREIMEIADFVRDPERYRRVGAKAPRGVLMTGPPGTGKTLIARALAGQVGVPFLSVTGSSFVEMFVGVGAARVRDLFEEARRQAPAIIFVDEIDAIGQRRQVGAVVSNEEREQTLNQLLAEMDGFDPSVGIVVLAATNRPEILDAALLRPGRFDRQVTIPLPNQSERGSILAVHCRGKQLAPDVDLDEVARGTPGFSGADLANLVNEAAIRAARGDRRTVTADDIDAARDRILIGQRDGSTVLLPEERHAVAVHEAGHALVAAHSPSADPVHKVTILPAGQALGVTQQLPEHERHLYSEDHLHDTLAVQLAGRAAERVVFERGSTGAANDLATATAIAVKMVREYGLSGALGSAAYPLAGPMYLDHGSPLGSQPYADDTQRVIDAEVGRILDNAHDRAMTILREHRDQLDEVVRHLLEEETIDGDRLYAITGRPLPPNHPQLLGTDSDARRRPAPDAGHPPLATADASDVVDRSDAAPVTLP